jgi:hypothetical protein
MVCYFFNLRKNLPTHMVMNLLRRLLTLLITRTDCMQRCSNQTVTDFNMKRKCEQNQKCPIVMIMAGNKWFRTGRKRRFIYGNHGPLVQSHDDGNTQATSTAVTLRTNTCLFSIIPLLAFSPFRFFFFISASSSFTISSQSNQLPLLLNIASK